MKALRVLAKRTAELADPPGQNHHIHSVGTAANPSAAPQSTSGVAGALSDETSSTGHPQQSKDEELLERAFRQFCKAKSYPDGHESLGSLMRAPKGPQVEGRMRKSTAELLKLRDELHIPEGVGFPPDYFEPGGAGHSTTSAIAAADRMSTTSEERDATSEQCTAGTNDEERMLQQSDEDQGIIDEQIRRGVGPDVVEKLAVVLRYLGPKQKEKLLSVL